MITFYEFLSNLQSDFDKTPPNKFFDFFPKLANTDLKDKVNWSNFISNILNVMRHGGERSRDAERSFNKILPYFKKDKNGTLNLIAYIIKNKTKMSDQELDTSMKLWILTLTKETLDILDDSPNPELN